MAAVTLAEVKTRLKIEADDTSRDDELALLVKAADEILYTLPGRAFDGSNPHAKLAGLFIIQDFYDQRGMSAASGYKTDSLSDRTRQVVDLVLSQLSFCYLGEDEA